MQWLPKSYVWKILKVQLWLDEPQEKNIKKREEDQFEDSEGGNNVSEFNLKVIEVLCFKNRY